MIQVIKQRHSVRTFEKKTISLDDEKVIQKIVQDGMQEAAPFGTPVKLYFLRNKDAHSPESKKVGMYGYVKHVPAYLTGSTENTKAGLLDFGYVFEKAILELVKRGFGTVWLSGDFDNEDLENFARKGHVVPVMAPVGYPGYKQSLKERFLRMKQEASDRKKHEELFGFNDFSTPVDKSHPYYEVLELVRLAPSALNKQPWRVLVKDDHFHLYLKRTEKFPEQVADSEMINMGIAMRHIMIGLKSLSHTGQILMDDAAPRPEGLEYVASIHVNS